MILSETPACYAHAQNVLMLHVGPGNLRLFGTFVPIRTPSGTLVQIRTRLRLFRLSTFPFVLFRHASIRRLCSFWSFVRFSLGLTIFDCPLALSSYSSQLDMLSPESIQTSGKPCPSGTHSTLSTTTSTLDVFDFASSTRTVPSVPQ